jgi:hypothetical protein
MNPHPKKAIGPDACDCCEGTGLAFNAIDAEWSTCILCGGSGREDEPGEVTFGSNCRFPDGRLFSEWDGAVDAGWLARQSLELQARYCPHCRRPKTSAIQRRRCECVDTESLS